jgi:CBS domain-containing protein
MDEPVVEHLMSTDLVTIRPGAAAADAAERMLETGVSSLLVVGDDGRLAGLITATDFAALVRRNDPEDETPVEAFMTTDLVTVSPEDSVEDLAELTDRGYTHLPVVDADDRLVGMLSTTDLTAYLSERR